MNKNNFWNDAARYGAVLGLVQVVFGALENIIASSMSNWQEAVRTTGSALAVAQTQNSTGGQLLMSVVTIVSLTVFFSLLLVFTRRRAAAVTADGSGFSFGDGLKFIVSMALCSALIFTVWEILSRNVIFHDWNAFVLNQSLDLLSQSFKSSSVMPLDEIMASTSRAFYSPMMILMSVSISLVIKGLFFGVFVALKTRREPDIFAKKDDNE